MTRAAPLYSGSSWRRARRRVPATDSCEYGTWPAVGDAAMNTTRLALLGLAALAANGCMDGDEHVATGSAALTVKSQLRGYDLGPPFPAGFRDSGLVNGYAEDEWVPFIAIMEGSKLEDADINSGSAGDGVYSAEIILPNFSPKQGANGLQDLQVTGTYGAGAITPIPDPFDDK